MHGQAVGIELRTKTMHGHARAHGQQAKAELRGEKR